MNQVEPIVKELQIGRFLGKRTVSGGSINDAYQIETTEGIFFLKLNSASKFPEMFLAEKKGLELLNQSSFLVPKPIKVGRVDDEQFILMEWVEQGSPGKEFWNEFGRNLAELHLLSSDCFGLNHDNYIGSLPQRNAERNTWTEFYREERLGPQMKLAEEKGRLSSRMKTGFENLFRRLGDIYPAEKSSLLHGDLWSGNIMVSETGSPCIFDPAVYYGHREMDLAMMALFGGFGENWVDPYQEVYPLEPDWRGRIEIGQLYPLMVHVNLFGGGYARSVEAILQNFR